MSAAESDVEVYSVPVAARKPLGYCNGRKHPTAYQRNVLVRCKAPLYTAEALHVGYCSYCLRKARDTVKGDKEFKELREKAKTTLAKADAYVNGLAKGTRKREKLISRIQKRRRNLNVVAPALKKRKNDVDKELETELKKSEAMAPVTVAEDDKQIVEQAIDARNLRGLVRIKVNEPEPKQVGSSSGASNELPVVAEGGGNDDNFDEQLRDMEV